MKKFFIILAVLLCAIPATAQYTWYHNPLNLSFAMLNDAFESAGRSDAVIEVDSAAFVIYKSTGGEWQLALYDSVGNKVFYVDTAGVLQSSNILPRTADTYDLGASGTEWDSAFVNILTATGINVDSLMKVDHIKANSADGLLLTDDGGNGISVEDGGNVSIWTAGSAQLLSVASATENAFVEIDGGSGDDAGIILQEGNVNKFLIRNDASRNSLSFYDYSISKDAVTIKEGGNVGIGTTEPSAQLDVSGDLEAEKFVSGTKTITASADDVDVSHATVLNCDTNGGNITIGGFVGGVDGQILHLYNSDTNDVILEDDEGTGNQDIKCASAADVTITAEGGVTLIYDGTDGVWRIIGIAQ